MIFWLKVLAILFLSLPFLKYILNLVLDTIVKILETVKLTIEVKTSFLKYLKLKKDFEKKDQLPNRYDHD